MKFLIANGNIETYSTITDGLVDYTFTVDYGQPGGVITKGNLTIPEYLESRKIDSHEILSTDEFMVRQDKHQREKYLTPAEEITEEQFYDMLEVLPPMNWHTDSEGIDKFMMCEFYTGDITAQYARIGDKFITKHVMSRDKDTHINKKDFELLSLN